MKVDLNADMGESYGRWTLGDDEALMPYLTSANIACGFHGGDPHVMRKTVALALEHGVGVGAHVAFPDLIGFGRRRLSATPEEIQDYVVYQAGAIGAFVEAAGGRLQHVKPHGALYTTIVDSPEHAAGGRRSRGAARPGRDPPDAAGGRGGGGTRRRPVRARGLRRPRLRLGGEARSRAREAAPRPPGDGSAGGAARSATGRCRRSRAASSSCWWRASASTGTRPTRRRSRARSGRRSRRRRSSSRRSASCVPRRRRPRIRIVP